ncbi:MAG: glutamate decarboxylase [Candidatus Paralactobacillus gallistercoris]|uniref:Glutamate decarboxylase n=1 Tax=Candidatus Paralactobacillus gallistercoris TaxID=2838724 RepID=A0A948X0M8_9LACO|nr:glutamate decarboxylase [Candidatus Paralactobacillus gallistercoris]
MTREYLEDSFLGSREAAKSMPKEVMPEEGMNPDLAETLIKHIRLNEAKADQNFATFCTTQMEPQADELMMSGLETNAIDKSEYPKTAAMENYCVSMLGHLWGLPEDKKLFKDFIGTSTVGSSEGCMLGGLAMLFSWKHRAKANGIDIDNLHEHRPNLVIVSAYQVVWEKFCHYWNVEMREVPMSKDDNGTISMDMDTVMDYVDENTIGIVSIEGITYTGGLDNTEKLNDLVEAYNQDHPKMPLRIHVDAASGGFYEPFMEGFKPWDFRLKNVKSINVSGHKYGMVYPGIGWIVWRENTKECLPEELRFSVPYLGGSVDSIAINFSRSGAHILGQYYNFVRFGKEGYHEVMSNTHEVAVRLADALEKFDIFDMVKGSDGLPIICWTLSKHANVNWTLYDLEDKLKEYGWQVPAYPLPKIKNVDQPIIVSRVVCRPAMTMAICDDFIEDLDAAIKELNEKFNK